ncbi:MAG: hypothetical protein U9O55_00035 [Patescibacteria group bacterium]|nr:hypothetical protein [Patescibacteria group bacterium]
MHKSHDKSAILYHIVCPVKYRRKIISEQVSAILKNICIKISKRLELM